MTDLGAEVWEIVKPQMGRYLERNSWEIDSQNVEVSEMTTAETHTQMAVETVIVQMPVKIQYN